MKMTANCKRQLEKNKSPPLGVRSAFLFGLLSLLCCCCPPQPAAAHFIHIDQNEFRASGFPRPPQNWPPLPPPIEQSQHLTAKERTPVELMVDLSNDLTYRILHYHSILNRNNFALSPTALMSVLVALYEGAAGRSAQELSNVLQLPGNRDIIRVGYRDIHRRLRTYFFGSENPLKGLSLNKDNVTISRDYETVLMFYGYDLGMDMVSSTVSPSTTTTASTIDKATTSETDIPTAQVTEETETKTETTEIPTTEKATTTVETITTSELTTETITKPPKTEVPTTETPTTEAPTTEAPTTEAPTTEAPTTVATEAPATNEGEDEAAELISSFIAEADVEPFLRIQKARVSPLPSGRLQAPPKAAVKSVSNIRVNYLPTARNGLNGKTSPNRVVQNRNKRHLFGFKELDANLFVTLFSPPSGHGQQGLIPISGPSVAAGAGFAHITNDYELNVEPQFIAGSGGSASETKQNYNTDVISHVFYLGNQQLVHTTFKVYNAVLYYKYFDSLKMSVLELELDTPEYNLMILLPDFHTDLVTAAAALRYGPTLRLMRKQLKPRWVQAIIPDFKVHGTMFLTNDLQNMGICDIFEPNRADFRPMTEEKGVYVKHIEQSINVNIRTHPINQLKRNYGAQTQPIQISVNHPFMFFIVDRDLDVAVMAGRILNPLNVRIQ